MPRKTIQITKQMQPIIPKINPITERVVSSSLAIPIAPNIIAKGARQQQQQPINPNTNANVP